MNQRMRKRPTPGHTVVELLAALAILGVVITLVGQLAGLSAALKRRGAAQREAAQEASNFLERATALPFEDIEEERLARLAADPQSAAVRLSISVHSSDAETIAGRRVAARQIEVVAEHEEFPGVSCRLLGWKHQLVEESP
jgi:type II secretory pathway pseudopilin PulG